LRSLTFQKRYQPAKPLYPQPATAFAVDTFYRNLYLAIGNNVYYGVLP
jgi:hypothetical protein